MTATSKDRVGRSRRSAVIAEALQLGSIEGLDALTIGRLAERSGMSKNGVFSHFGSKQDLQIATLEAAREVFVEHVIAPALQVRPGVRRLRALLEAWLNYLQDDVFPGGCFLLAASYEWDNRPGEMRDRVAATMNELNEFLLATISECVEMGDIRGQSPSGLAFELHAVVSHANLQFQLFRNPQVFEAAREAIRERLSPA